MTNLISTLVGESKEGYSWGSVAASNGSIYCIRFSAHRVVKFDPVSKSMTHIEPNLVDACRWHKDAITDNAIIYSVRRQGILKIDMDTDTGTVLDANFLPERGVCLRWTSCAAAIDGCIYCIPYCGHRKMKIYPNNNDARVSLPIIHSRILSQF